MGRRLAVHRRCAEDAIAETGVFTYGEPRSMVYVGQGMPGVVPQ